MKIKILLTSVLAISISNAIYADYSIIIPLEDQKITFNNPEVVGNITLSPSQINRGESSTIVWDYTYADEINIENVGTYHSLKGSTTVSPNESTDYNVIIKNGDKTKTDVLHLVVIQPSQNIIFNADSYRIGYGSNTNLNWNVTNAESVKIDQNIGSQSLSGSYKISPLTTTTYTLTAQGFTGISDSIKTVSVTVVPDATISEFQLDKDKISVGDTATLIWNVLNAEAVTLNGENVDKITGSKSIEFKNAGSFSYKLQTESLSGLLDYSDEKIINVYNNPIIESLTSTKNSIDEGESVNLQFTTKYSSTNEINGINMGSNLNYTVSPQATTTYTLVAKNEAGKTTNRPITITVQNWLPTTPLYGDWTSVTGKTQYNCLAWSPNPSTVTTNTTFTQTASCSTDQTRTRQDRVMSSTTGEVKNIGSVTNETNTILENASRSYGVTLTSWVGSTITSCPAWTPSPSTVNKGESFTQTGVNCALPQTRTRTENYIDHLTSENVIVSVVTENQTLKVSGATYPDGTRSAIGTKVVTVCMPKSSTYSWTYGQIGSDPSQVGTTIIWNSEKVYEKLNGGPYSSVSAGSYNYTNNTSTICRY